MFASLQKLAQLIKSVTLANVKYTVYRKHFILKICTYDEFQ